MFNFKLLINLIKSKFGPYINGFKSSFYVRSSIIGDEVVISSQCKIYKARLSGKVSIGQNTSIYGPNTHVLAKLNPITIGKYCSIAHNVTIIEYSHNYRKPTTYYYNQNILQGDVKDDLVSNGPIVIGNDVWVGCGAVILGGVVIGNGAVIAANSVITKDVKPYAIMAGNPARLVKMRFTEEKIKYIEGINWWDFSREELINKEHFFRNEL